MAWNDTTKHYLSSAERKQGRGTANKHRFGMVSSKTDVELKVFHNMGRFKLFMQWSRTILKKSDTGRWTVTSCPVWSKSVHPFIRPFEVIHHSDNDLLMHFYRNFLWEVFYQTNCFGANLSVWSVDMSCGNGCKFS